MITSTNFVLAIKYIAGIFLQLVYTFFDMLSTTLYDLLSQGFSFSQYNPFDIDLLNVTIPAFPTDIVNLFNDIVGLFGFSLSITLFEAICGFIVIFVIVRLANSLFSN